MKTVHMSTWVMRAREHNNQRSQYIIRNRSIRQVSPANKDNQPMHASADNIIDRSVYRAQKQRNKTSKHTFLCGCCILFACVSVLQAESLAPSHTRYVDGRVRALAMPNKRRNNAQRNSFRGGLGQSVTMCVSVCAADVRACVCIEIRCCA